MAHGLFGVAWRSGAMALTMVLGLLGCTQEPQGQAPQLTATTVANTDVKSDKDAKPGAKPASPASAAKADSSKPAAKPAAKEVPMVKVRMFNKEGKLVGPVLAPRVVLTDAQWQARLTPAQYGITRAKGTEPRFCGTLLDNKKEGVYACVCCGLPLFSSNAKFNSGTGWPSFFQPIAPENVAEHVDRGHGMVRTEILCARCDAHLGHVFDDGPKPTGRRHCLNSESLTFTLATDVAKLADPAAEAGAAAATDKPATDKPASDKPADKPAAAPSKPATATAVLAGGCFWCTEVAFEHLKGVSDVTSGYIGGKKETANYEAVCRGNTGHAEAIRITYDPSVVSFKRLLEVFFESHDPTQLNAQGNDHGTQYRSAIFFASPEEKQAAQATIEHLTKIKAFPEPIVTTLEPLSPFYVAEDYHQDYAQLNPNKPYIQFHAIPKACKVRDKHPEWFKRDPADVKKDEKK